MRKKILLTMTFSALGALGLAFLFVFGALYGFFTGYIQDRLVGESGYVATAMERETDPKAYLSALEVPGATTRITWVDTDGTVLFDSLADPATMENHLTRPEIADALANGTGESARYSETRKERTFYYAVRLEDGTVIRLSSTQKSVWSLLGGMVPALLFGLAVALGIFALVANHITKSLVMPINLINLEDPLSNDIYDELSPLLSRLSYQNKEIASQIQMLKEKQTEFEAITMNMREGLILLNKKAYILSINQSAKSFFGTGDEDMVGKNILELLRSLPLQKAAEQALKGSPAAEVLCIRSRDYQLLSSPVRQNGEVRGAVLLLVDITDKREAERMRREFSANVSHELKTPLTSILGYAEILKNGMARPEDVAEFADRIYRESTRLIALIDDILRLSRLDEGNFEAKKEPVDLLALSQNVCERLRPEAEKHHVRLSVGGQKVIVLGIPHILEEMIYNLCDNAIKYNRENGEAFVHVFSENDRPVLRVSDTGIGIPQEHQAKVFERFYRVDKSRSKLTGGTGLGLAIVKHAALYHGAQIDLKSTEGSGTVVTVIFPPADIG